MSIDIIKELEKLAAAYRKEPPSARKQTIMAEVIAHFRKLMEIEYVGDLYRTDYEVEGEGRFPLDMLRYACSWPAREEDEAALLGGHDAPLRRARLSTYHRDPMPQLAETRWESKFRWRVVGIVQTVPT